ncbi:MAG TPA: peptidoglycan DD-metalloendopeptidase family protein [Solirubrobacterales bacterium]|jgi:murein DD-endopeptidase MepM/ murein hydrolase activator NlpD|nr:peptidoglycan DD-metalloendopeptidase family protein [Solirubrobacterales bacterium]
MRQISNITETFNARLPRTRAVLSLLALVTALSLLYLALPLGSNAKTAAQLQQDIARKKAREGVLTGDIQRMGSKIKGLQGRIGKLQSRQSTIEADLNRKVSRQQQIADDLDTSRKRLARLKKRLAYAKKVLSARIVSVYKSGEPDILTVVLHSDGFAQMVERATYLHEVAKQDHHVITTVTKLKGSTKRETVKLAALENEARQLVAQVRERRDQVASAKNQLDARRGDLAGAVSNRKSTLASVSKSRQHDEEDLSAMNRSSQTVAGYLQGSPGPIKHGSGRFIYPINGTFTSPFGMRWGRLHAGIDLAAATGTPIRAADSGTVRFAGVMSGYGNYTCIQHTGSLSTCYAHQSSIGVRVGQSVKQGQVIGLSGNTGHSTGPHLHFEVRVNGNPVDPMGYL